MPGLHFSISTPFLYDTPNIPTPIETKHHSYNKKRRERILFV